MKRIICFVLGFLIGATGVFYFGDYLKEDSDKATVSRAESTGSYDKSKTENNIDENDSIEKVSIDTTSHLSYGAVYGDDTGFTWPSEDLLNPLREGDNFIYDTQKNGKIALVNIYGVGMSKMMADIYVTSDYGKNWKTVSNDKVFINGFVNVIYIGDTIIISNSNDVSINTCINIIKINTKDSEYSTNEENIITFAHLIGESSDLHMTALPIVLSKDTENNTVLCAWHRCTPFFSNHSSKEVILISEHDGTTFEITKEFYRNNTAISNIIKECNE